jgi:hypothetical protein
MGYSGLAPVDLESEEGKSFAKYNLPFEGIVLPKIPSVEKTRSGIVENEGYFFLFYFILFY